MIKRNVWGAMALAVSLTGVAMAQSQGSQGSEGSEEGTQGSQEGAQGSQGAQEGSQSGSARQGGDSFSKLSREQIMQLQTELQSRGHYQGRIDGIVGPLTRAAVAEFQKEQQLSGSGELNEETASALGLSIEGGRQPVRGMEEPQRQPIAGTEMTQTMELASMGEADARQLQTWLKERGLYRGDIDGVPGQMTRTALQEWFRSQAQLASRGMIDQNAMCVIRWTTEMPGMGEPGTQQPQGTQPGTRPGTPGTQQPGTQPAPGTAPR